MGQWLIFCFLTSVAMGAESSLTAMPGNGSGGLDSKLPDATLGNVRLVVHHATRTRFSGHYNAPSALISGRPPYLAAVSLGSGLRSLPPPCPAGQNSLPTFFRPTNFVLKFDLKRQRMFLRNPCGARVPQKKGEGKEALLVLALLASPPHAYF